MQSVDKRSGEVLETVEFGKVSGPTLQELVRLKAEAKSAAKEFADAIEAQAKKHRVKKPALRRYVTAIEADKLHDLHAETESLAGLMGLE